MGKCVARKKERKKKIQRDTPMIFQSQAVQPKRFFPNAGEGKKKEVVRHEQDLNLRGRSHKIAKPIGSSLTH
jgi:hypothetical protein